MAARKRGTRAANGGRRGAPPIEYDPELLRDLAELALTDEEMAGPLRMSVRTIERRRATDPEFKRICEEAQAAKRVSLKRRMWACALQCSNIEAPRGAVTMAIFLAKQPTNVGGLGWTDRKTLQHELPPDDQALRSELGDKLDRLAARADASRKAARKRRAKEA